MGIFGTMAILSLIAYSLFIFTIKIFGSLQKEDNYDSTEQAIQKDTDEFNHFS